MDSNEGLLSFFPVVLIAICIMFENKSVGLILLFCVTQKFKFIAMPVHT